MSARDRIGRVLFDEGWTGRTLAYGLTDAVIAAIRAMTVEELRELRPDIADLFDLTRQTAAARGAYIIATAPARAADGRRVVVRVVVDDEGSGS